MKYLLALALLGVSADVHAQTVHPCDVAAPSSAVVVTATTYKVRLCAKVSDSPEAFTVYTNGVASDLRPLTQAVGPNAAGLAVYEGPRELQFPKGTYQIQVTVWNKQFQPDGPSQESPKSQPPLALSVVDSLPIPTAPMLLGIAR